MTRYFALAALIDLKSPPKTVQTPAALTAPKGAERLLRIAPIAPRAASIERPSARLIEELHAAEVDQGLQTRSSDRR